jgi:hypothetical protein
MPDAVTAVGCCKCGGPLPNNTKSTRCKSCWAKHPPAWKRCSKCRKAWPIAYFVPHPQTNDGYDSRCRICHARHKREVRLHNRVSVWWAPDLTPWSGIRLYTFRRREWSPRSLGPLPPELFEIAIAQIIGGWATYGRQRPR